MNFYSNTKQDEFVANILNHYKNGIYIDIGSNESKISNNSFYFDSNLNWRGICVEIDNNHFASYSNRKNCTLIIDNALAINYTELFKIQNFPNIIDYLSIDIDTSSLDCLKLIPLDQYRFKVITIEHDGYLYADVYRKPQREILLGLGYTLICSNVFVEQEGFEGKKYPFEDWYISSEFFSKPLIQTIKSDMEYPSEIISKFKLLNKDQV